MTTPTTADTLTDRMRAVLAFVASDVGYGSQTAQVTSMTGDTGADVILVLLERDGYVCHNRPVTGTVHRGLWWPTRLGLDTAYPGSTRPAWDPRPAGRYEGIQP